MGPEVLILDSWADSAEMYAVGLGLAGFRTLITSDTGEAWAHLHRRTPIAIVAEMGVAAADGWQFLRRLRSRRSTREIPVVLLTGRVARPAELDELPAARLLLKPCLPDTLAAVLRDMLAEPGWAGRDFSRPVGPLALVPSSGR